MNPAILAPLVAAFVVGLSGIHASEPAADRPSYAADEPPVPAELAARGAVYHTISGKQTQVTFTSRAPLENIVGKSNRVVGYAVAGPADHPTGLVGASWLLPVESLATGLPLRDDHLAHEWLEAQEYPNIRFDLTDTEAVELVKEGEGFSTWSMTLMGEMSLHGVTKAIRVPDTKVSFLAASDKTASIAPGDLCFVKCDYTIRMSDFGIHHKDVPDKVSDEIRLVQMLRLSTVVQKD